MNPFAKAQSGNSGFVVIILVAIVIGLLGSMAFAQKEAQDDRRDRLPAEVRTGVDSGTLDAAEELKGLREEVTKLRQENTGLQNAASQGSSLTKELNESLQQIKEFACLTELEGPGITIILQDSKKSEEGAMDPNSAIIHDADVVRVINELWNAGAEAISVNGKRAGPGTSYRCAGSVIVVDNERFASPIIIRAIGDTKTLDGALSLPGGVISEFKELDPAMVEVKLVEKHHLPAYDGSTTKKWAKLPQD